MIKVSNNFYLPEFINPSCYKLYGDKSIRFIDPRIINVWQFVRDRFDKPVTINDWKWGGKRKLSGLRPFYTLIGASMSQHKFGRGGDGKVQDVFPVELQNDIIENFELYKAHGLTTMERGTSGYTHLDCRNVLNKDKLFIIDV